MKWIDAVDEMPGRNHGVVTAYYLDPVTGKLSYINTQGTLGSVPVCDIDAPINKDIRSPHWRFDLAPRHAVDGYPKIGQDTRRPHE